MSVKCFEGTEVNCNRNTYACIITGKKSICISFKRDCGICILKHTRVVLKDAIEQSILIKLDDKLDEFHGSM